MASYLASRWIRGGLALLLLGTGPLAYVMIRAKLGITSDPNPNPVLHGMLAGFTFWPSLLLIAIGVWRVRRQNAR
jgi:hypothetical protein